MKNQEKQPTVKEVFDAITDRLSQPNGAVQVTTYTRSTVYKHAHRDWFSFENGDIYVRQGRGRVKLSMAGKSLLVSVRLAYYQ